MSASCAAGQGLGGKPRGKLLLRKIHYLISIEIQEMFRLKEQD